MSLNDNSFDELPQQKKTLGQQLIENHAANVNSTQTVRDTTNEMGKKYMESLEKVIIEHAHLTEEYYITEVLKPDSHLPNVIRLQHTARKTRPLPEWGLAMYKVTPAKHEVTYEWGLPHQAEAQMVLSDPYGWDQKLVQDIKDHMLGILR